MSSQTIPLTKPRSHAIVIGGGIAGLFAARVLSDYSEQVTIIERDQLPDAPIQRKGIPQARHAHVLLARGQHILERLFPGITADLIAAGAVTIHWTEDCLIHSFAGWIKRFPSDKISQSCSRELLEYTIRRRLMENPHLQWRTECEVTGLQPNQSGNGIAGVYLRRRSNNIAHEELLSADLVVDASGRSSHAPTWLESLGYPPPTETVVNSFLGYASRVYQRPSHLNLDWKIMLVRGAPPHSTRGGGIYLLEGDCWIVTLGGTGADHPPTDEQGFLEFIRSLPDKQFYELIKNAKPLSAISGYQRTENRWRHFERLSRWPEHFIMMGDAVCAFNPVYGQGMTVAAMMALTLDDCLRAQPKPVLTNFASHFQQRAAKLIADPWLLATSEDRRILHTKDMKTSPLTKLAHWYMDRLVRHATSTPALFDRFFSVTHLLKPVSTLFHPSIVIQVLGRIPADRFADENRFLEENKEAAVQV